jgi:hypothetical protein
VKTLKYVFLLIGSVMLFGSFKLYSDTASFLEIASKAEGSIIELIEVRSDDSVTYKPVFEFTTTKGETFEITSSSSSNPPSYFIGEAVEVLYEDVSPRDAKINGYFSLWGFTTILGALGAIFLIVGFGIIAYGSIKLKKVSELKENGVAILAKYQSVQLNKSLKVNGQSPYQIHAQWTNPSTSKVHIFKSDNIWFDPSEFIDRDQMTVLIEKDNPKKYYVDITFLPEIAG